MCATSPEELETLLEDALLLGDDAAAAALFEDRGVLISRGGSVFRPADAASLLGEPGYVASVQPATVIRDVAVVVGDTTANVSRRGADGSWRLVASICLPGAGSQG